MQLDLYQNLLMRYSNQIYLIDDYGTKGVILCNEPKERIMRMFLKYKSHKLSFVQTKEIKSFVPWLNKIVTFKHDVYKIDIIEFVKFALVRGYDWKLYGEPEWEDIRPKKKKKFIKPRKR